MRNQKKLKEVPAVLHNILQETGNKYAKECGISEQTDDCVLRPDGLQDHVNMLLRRELVRAAEQGNSDLLNELTYYVSIPKDFVLCCGLMTDMRLCAENNNIKRDSGAIIVPIPVNKKAWLYLEMKHRVSESNSIN